MSRTVLIYGLVYGAISSVLMASMMIFMASRMDPAKPGEAMQNSALVGYSAMVLAATMIFFGVRSYREGVGGGAVSFSRALSIGLLMTVVSALCYVVTWELMYFVFMPEMGHAIMEGCMANMVAGAPPEQAAEVARKAEEFKTMYENPLINSAFTFMEPLPVGVAISLISAAILRRRPQAG